MSLTWWRRWWNVKSQTSPRGRGRPAHRRTAPLPLSLEPLEARNLLSLGFAAPANYTVGGGPSAVIAADVNNDGNLDVITTNLGSNNVSVLLGNANGTFAAQQLFPTLTQPTDVAAGDFRNDGKLDLLVTANNQLTAGIMLGNGNGTFQPVRSITSGTASYGVVLGDFNGDGKLDAAVTDYNNDVVDVMLGQGDGTFQSQQTFAVGTHPTKIVAGDFSHDGKLDLAITNATGNSVSVLMGNGNGTFQPQVTYAVGNNPTAIVAGDLLHNGNLDLVALNRADSTVSVLLGNGNGTFVPQVTYGTSTNPTGLALADFTNDGQLDLATSNFMSSSASVMLGNGNGTFGSPQVFAAGTAPMAIAAADVNHDGAPDLLVADFSANVVSVLLNQPAATGSLFFNLATTFTTGTTPVAEATGDFNHDGNPDVVTANLESNTVSVILGNGNGTFQNKFILPTGVQPDAVAVGDLNDDGRLDIVVANFGSNTVSVILGNGDGSFKPQQVFAVGSEPDAVALGDFTGNGLLDIAVANAGSNNVSVLLNNGNDTFQNQLTFSVDNAPSSLAVGDFNGDHNQDLVVTNYASNDMSLLLGNGNGTFQPEKTFVTGTGPRSIIAADLNNNNHLDVAFVNAQGNSVGVMLGNGNGSFAPATAYAAGIIPSAVAAGDFNNDSKLDLAVTDAGNGQVAILTGNGNGTFQNAVNFPTGVSPFAVVTGYFNSDRNLDLAVANGSSSTVSVMLGNGNGTFQFHATSDTQHYPEGVAAGDLNNDKKLDAVVANAASNSISILLGNANGTFQDQQVISVGVDPVAVALGDFNGFTGIAVVNAGSNSISIITTNNASVVPSNVQTYAVGVDPRAVAIGDFNGDGKMDLAVANEGSNTVSVLLGNGDGTFAPQMTFAVGALPDAIATGSFTGDNNIDIAVANYGSKTVSVLLGNGDGTFAPQKSFAVGLRPSDLVVRNFGNGNTDIVTTNEGDNTISVLLGKGDGTFLPQITLAVGISPTSIVTGDFNGDGNFDLAVANLSSNTVSILAGNGDGTFKSQQTFSTILGPFALATGDFNNDTKLDLITTHPGNDTAAVLLGNGNGTFQNELSLSTGLGSFSSAMGDFGNNGKLDVAVTNPLNNTVSVLLNNGDGTFQTSVVYATGSLPKSVVTAQLTHSGNLDLIVTNEASDTISVLLGNGNGTFQPQLTFATGLSPESIAVGDFNGDGNPDIVVTNELDNTVSVLLGNGNGTFLQAQPYAVGFGPFGVVVGDFANTGKLDIAVTDAAGNSLSVLMGNGNGTFQPQQVYATGTKPKAIVMGNFNGDNNIDLAVANYGSSTLSVFLGNGNGTFQPQQVMATGWRPTALAVGSFFGDANQDIAVANYGSNTVSLFQGNGNGTFAQPTSTQTGAGPFSMLAANYLGGSNPVAILTFHNGANLMSVLEGDGKGHFQLFQPYATGQAPSGLVVGDFSNNGQPDVVTANNNSISISVLAGNGDGTFVNQSVYPTLGPVRSIVEGDFNDDGKLDLAVALDNSNLVEVFLGNGNGTFQAPLTFTSAGSGPGRLAVGDFLNNGQLDLAVLRTNSNVVSLLLGNGNGTFQTVNVPTIAVPSGTNDLTVGDFNHDGNLDLATAGNNGVVDVFLGNGNGTFQSQLSTFAGVTGNLSAIAVGDFNSDGKEDLTVTSEGPSKVYVLLGNGDGTFAWQPGIDTGFFPTAVVTGDFNGDGKTDIAVANYASNSVTVLAGNGNGTFQAAQTFQAGSGPRALAVGDLNRDGTLDIVTANALSNNIAPLLNEPQAVAFQVLAPATVTAGTPFTITVTALNGGLSTAVGYTGTITFSSTDPNAGLPASYTFTAADKGVHIFTVTLDQAGKQMVTVTDSANASLVGSASIQTQPGAAKSYVITIPQNVSASSPFSIAVTALDAFGNTATNYAGTVQFTSSDPGATLPASYTFTPADQGVHIFTNGVTFRTVGTQSITAKDSTNQSVTGQGSTTVAAASSDHYSLGAPATVSAGQFFSLTVTVLNSNNQTDTGYTGTVHFTTTDSTGTMPLDYTFTAADHGVHTFTFGFQLLALGNQTISATDTLNPQVTGSTTVAVNPISTTHFSISMPAQTVAGQPFQFTVTALTATGKVDTSYRGTVQFSSSDASAGVVLPTNYTFTFSDQGTHTFTATLDRVGAQGGLQTVSVFDTALSQVSGTGAIQVTPAAATQLQIVALDNKGQKTSNVNASFPFSLQVTAFDPFGNVATNYQNVVQFSSTDSAPGVVLPGNYQFTAADGGTHTFTLGATLQTVGSRTIFVKDPAANITGSVVLAVSTAASDVILVTGPASAAAGAPFSLTVTVYTPQHTIDNNYRGTIHFTTSDPFLRSDLVLPPNYTFTASDAGTHTFANAAVLGTVGLQSVTAQDTTTPLIPISAFVTITPGAPTHFAINTPTTVQAGSPFGMKITVLDQYNNIVTNFTDTVQFTTTDPATGISVPTSYTFTLADAGVHQFLNNSALILRTAGVQSITANDPSVPGLKSSAVLNVTPGPIASFSIVPSGVTSARFPFDVTVVARDAFGNVATNYTGTVAFSSSDPLAVLPANYTFTAADAGVHVFHQAFALQTLGTQTVSVRDFNSTFAIQGTGSVTVSPETADTYILITPPVVNASVPFSFTVAAVTPNGTIDTNASSTITFTSSDGGAMLPAAYTFQPSDAGVHTFMAGVDGATFKTVGSQTLTVTDGLRSTTSTIVVNPFATDYYVISAPATTVTGVPFTMQVTVFTPAGNLDPNYRGTIHFTSSDPSASLPTPYTFTAGDAGSHTFTLQTALNTPGPKVISAADTLNSAANGFITGSTTVLSTPAPTDTFQLSYSSNTIVGAPFDVTVTALLPNGQIDKNYEGTVHFTSSDSLATLPVDYTFTSSDAGVHTFSNGVILRSLGTQTVTVSDTTNAAALGTTSISVTAASNDLLGVALPLTVVAGKAFTFTVTAYDSFHNVDASYLGTVHFTASDAAAGVVLPIDYTFTNADHGVHTFTATLITAGAQSITATDATTAAITGTGTTTVLPSTPSHFTVSAPATANGGTPFSMTVTVLDQFNNVAAGYVGTIQFNSSDTKAVLPPKYTFMAADAGVHTFTNAFILNTPNPAAQIVASDTLQSSIMGTATIAVAAQVSDTLQIKVQASASAGSPFDVTVTALKPDGTVDTAYAGTIHFSSTDAQATLPPNYTFQVSDQGVHTFVNGVTFQSQGLQVLSAADTVTATILGSAKVQVGPALGDVLDVVLPASLGVGKPFSITVTAMKGSTVDTSYLGTIHFTSSVPGGVVPADYTFVATDLGQHTFVNGGLFDLAGTQSVTATDTFSSAITGTGLIQMLPAAANHFAVLAPASANAGAPITVTVEALDPFNNVVTNFSDKIHFSSTDQAATLPVNYAFTAADAGVHTFASGAIFGTLGPQTITVTDTSNATVTGAATLTINRGSNDLFSVAAPGSSPAGTPFTVTITVFTATGQVDTNYRGTVHFTSSDPSALLPADYAFTAADQGRHTFTNGFTLSTAGSQTVSATDAINSLIAGSAAVTINLAQSDLLSVSAPSTSSVGVPFSITVSALDPFHNVDPTYRGTIHFTSSDTAAGLPANYTFTAADAGQHTFTGLTLQTVGRQSITATDTVTSSITGTAFVQNNPVAAAQFSIQGPGNAAPGVPFNIVVTAEGAEGTTATSYLGTIHFSSSDTSAGLPADYTFTVLDRGVHTFTGVTLATLGSQTITATDVRTSSITGTSNSILVSSTVADHFAFVAPSSIGASTPFSVTITAVDKNGDPITNYLGTVAFTSSDPKAVLPANYTFTAADNGTHTFTGLSLGTLGAQTIQVADVFTTSISATIPVQVTIVTPSRFLISNAPGSVSTAQPFSLTVTAVDSQGNPLPGYRGTVHFSSTDGAASLPADYTFTAADNGSHTFTGLMLNTAGMQTVTVSDTTSSAINGSATITVNAVVPARFGIALPSRAQSGTPFSVTVSALDANGNVLTGFTGTVHFTTSDTHSGVVLPADYTFTAADHGVHTFTNAVVLQTPGHQFISATYTAQPNVVGTGSVAVTAGPLENFIVTAAGSGGGPVVNVYDAATGALKYSFFAYSPFFTGGVRVAVGDVNGDGIPDIITAPGPGGGPQINVYDGSTGQLIRSFFAYNPLFAGGVFIAAGDVTGAGHADIIVGAGAGGGPNVTVFDGATGAVISNFFAYNPLFVGGVRVAAGDVNAAGHAEIITGAGPGGGPNVTVFNGTTGQALSSFFAFNPAFNLGVYVASGDVNGDGHDDIIVGAGEGGGPQLTVFNGIDDSVLYSLFPFNPQFTGGVRVGAVASLDGSHDDVLVGPGAGGGPQVLVYDGLAPTLVDQFFAFNPAFSGGLFVAGNPH